MLTDRRMSVSLEEMRRAWSLDDVLDACDALEVRDEVEAAQAAAMGAP